MSLSRINNMTRGIPGKRNLKMKKRMLKGITFGLASTLLVGCGSGSVNLSNNTSKPSVNAAQSENTPEYNSKINNTMNHTVADTEIKFSRDPVYSQEVNKVIRPGYFVESISLVEEITPTNEGISIKPDEGEVFLVAKMIYTNESGEDVVLDGHGMDYELNYTEFNVTTGMSGSSIWYDPSTIKTRAHIETKGNDGFEETGKSVTVAPNEERVVHISVEIDDEYRKIELDDRRKEKELYVDFSLGNYMQIDTVSVEFLNDFSEEIAKQVFPLSELGFSTMLENPPDTYIDYIYTGELEGKNHEGKDSVFQYNHPLNPMEGEVIYVDNDGNRYVLRPSDKMLKPECKEELYKVYLDSDNWQSFISKPKSMTDPYSETLKYINLHERSDGVDRFDVENMKLNIMREFKYDIPSLEPNGDEIITEVNAQTKTIYEHYTNLIEVFNKYLPQRGDKNVQSNFEKESNEIIKQLKTDVANYKSDATYITPYINQKAINSGKTDIEIAYLQQQMIKYFDKDSCDLGACSIGNVAVIMSKIESWYIPPELTVENCTLIPKDK